MSKASVINHDDKLIRVDNHPVTRVQSFGYDTNMNYEDQYEIGNENMLESRVDDIITTTIRITTNDWGTVDLFAQLMGAESGLDLRKNLAVVTQDHLKKAEVDITVPVQEDDVWTRTTWLPNCYLSSFTFNYSVDGKGTEEYNFDGGEDYEFPGDYHEMSVDVGTYATPSTFTVPTSNTGKSAAYITINDVIYDTSHFSWSDTTVTITDSNLSINSKDRLRLIYYDTTPASSFTKLDTAGISTVHAGQAKIKLAGDGDIGNINKTLRVQSVRINGTLERDQNKELGTKQIVGRTLRSKSIEVTVTVDESDLEEYAYLCGITKAQWDDWSNNELILYPSRAIGKSNSLKVEVYDDADQSYLLKTILLTNLSFVGRGNTQDVQAKGQITYTLRGSYITVSGNGIPAGSRLAGSKVYPSIWN